MNPMNRRRPRQFRPAAERVEDRLLLSASAVHPLRVTPGFHPLRPNTPVLPYAAPASVASFIDPSAHIVHGDRIAIGRQVFVAPYSTLDAAAGFIKVGTGSTIQDNALIQANPDRQPGLVGVAIGDNVAVGIGAVIRGNSVIGAYGAAAKPTSIGVNALIDGATIAPGAIVSTLARVGPGVTVPAGFRVLPGVNVTNNAEASNPALGKVVAVTPDDLTALNLTLSNNKALAAGYTSLYQGDKATGASPGTSDPNVFNGNLAAVLGVGQAPGATPQSPKFPSAHMGLVQVLIPGYPARITGGAAFAARAKHIAAHVRRGNSIRADEGQPIIVGSIAQTGQAVTIHSPLGGQVLIGLNLSAGDGARILGGPGVVTTLGDNVSVGSGAVVDRSLIGSNAVIGARAYVSQSTLAPGTVVPPGTLLIKNKVVGQIAW